MRLTVLGSGSTIPNAKRTSSAYFIETSQARVLLDCAATAPARMAHEGLDWPNLDGVWVSHFHMDHCGGIGPLLAGTKHAQQMKGRKKPLRIFGPAGTEKLVKGFSEVNNYRLLEQPFPVEIVEVEPLERFEIAPGLAATALKTPHTSESLAIHLDDSTSTLVYSADTAFSEELAAFAARADLFILECTYPYDKPVKKHLDLPEAIYLIRKAAPRRAMLTHFYPDWDDVDFEKEIANHNPQCEVIEATDGLRVEIGVT